MTTIPYLDDDWLEQRRKLASLAPPPVETAPVMNAPMPRLEQTMPNVVAAPGARDLTRDAILRDGTELNRLRTTGSGVDQILHPADGSQASGLRKFGGVLARIGDAAGTILAPGIAAAVPGTTLHNLRLQNQAQGRYQGDLNVDKEQAGTELLNAQPELKQAALDNKSLQIGNQQQHFEDQRQHWTDQHHANLARNGYAVDESDPTGNKIRPLRYEEMSEQQQAVEDLKHAQQEQAEATAALKKAQNDPNSPAYRLAKQRNDIAARNAQTAIGRLGLQGQGLAMRREMMDANLYGTGPDGQSLPGAAQIMGEDGQTHTVGLRATSNAVKQQKAVGTFNDLVGSSQHATQALEALHSSGGALNDAKMIAAMSDPHSTIGKYVNGKLVRGSLNDPQIQAIGALNQLREQIGILRATTGGTAAEAQAVRMLDTLPSAGDSPAIVRNKMKELQGVLQRVSPAMTGVQGGLRVGARPSAPRNSVGRANVFSERTGTYEDGRKVKEKPDGSWVFVDTGKPVE